ncbi:MAG: hypothetical protein MJ125_01860 [Clostridia bacterium]|nr:hypothetical protein [Clostridia bacterium]
MPALLTKITAFFTAAVLFFTGIITSFYPRIPDAEPLSELEDYRITKKLDLGEDIYVVNPGGHSEEEIRCLISLQGLVAKKNPCIYIAFNSVHRSYLNELEQMGKNLIRQDGEGKDWNLYSLIEKFMPCITDRGCVVWEKSEFAYSLNVAVNFATVYGWLPVTREVLDKLGEGVLTVKKDLTTETNDLNLQKKYFDELKDKFNPGAVIHVKYTQPGVRDLAIQQGWYCCYTESDDSGMRFLKKVAKYFGENTRFLGWVQNEKKCVSLLSKQGCTLTPVDYSENTSYLCHIDVPVVKQESNAVAHTDETKHYVCLLFSDGDNVQWIMNNGYGEYFDKVDNLNDVKMSWTFSPVANEFSPLIHNKIYNSAGMTNTFVCGPSGVAYANPSQFKKSALDKYSRDTAAAMLKSNQRIITILDDYYLRKEADMIYSFGYFSRYDNIDGGLLYLDPDRYEAGKGRIWFSNDKPFVSTRLSLWNSDGYDGATDEWIKQQADIVNVYPFDIHSINGYSLICVHAWTMKTESIGKFVDALGDNVEILSAEDFIETISANVPHNNTVPDTAE